MTCLIAAPTSVAGLARLVGLTGVIVVSMAAITSTARAKTEAETASLVGKDVPEALRPWSGWVLHDHEQERCPVLTDGGDDNDGVCVWAGRLILTLDARGGRFNQDVDVFAPGPVALPGDGATWPLDVKVNGKAAVVVPGETDGDGDAPVVHLPIGHHTVQGTFAWGRLPESLPVPPSTALLGLTLLGRRVEFPSRSDKGELFLQKQEEEIAEEDKLDIAVHRHITDDVPMLLTTRLVLNVSGKTREVVLGRSLPEAFLPHTIDSRLPVRIESDGRLRVQLRPGTWTVTLVARRNAAVAKLQRPVPDGAWKDGDEVWVFAAQPSLRTVTIEGVPTIDPQQTTLPDEWRKLPAYLMVPGATMTLAERRRGNANPPADQLTLRRHLWLDFDGGGFTARDKIAGTFQRGWRLAMGPESKMGRVAVGGQDQFITRLGTDGPEGVEIRQTRASLTAESRITGARGDIPAVGWAEDFQSVSAVLALPPGWSLVHASGADSVSETWIMRWTLLDLFLLLITGIGIGKIFGWRTGLLALITLGLVLPQGDAPKWIWLCVLVAEALVRALPAGRLRWVASGMRLGTWVVLVVLAIPFAVQEVRVGLHPALDAAHAAGDGARYQQYATEQEEDIPDVERLRKGEQGKMAKREAAEEAAKQAGVLGLLRDNKAGGLSDLMESESAMGEGGMGLSGIGVAGGGGLGKKRKFAAAQQYGLRGAPAPAASQNLASYDPNVMVQTGPGIPRWTWNTISFDWNGPVDKAQRLKFWLLPPWLNMVLGFARVCLMALLVLRLFGGRRGLSDGLRLGTPGAGGAGGAAMTAATVLLVLFALFPARAVAADFPDDALLGKLRERLLEKPDCHPNCVALGRLALEAAPDRLRLRFEVGAVAPAAVPLPGHAQHWLPDTVLSDGKPATTLTRADDGHLWLRVTAGSHQVVMEGPLPPRETVQVPFKMLPRAVTVTSHGWKIEGLTDDGRIDGNLQLSRITPKPSAADGATGSPKAQGLEAASLPPFVIVERTLELGLKWEARTRVRRQTSSGAAVVVEVPLLPGESVVTGGVHVAKGRVQVNLGAGETEIGWSSTLAERTELVLEAPAPGTAAASSWSESWFVNASPVWHVVFAGIPPVDAPGNAFARVPGWRPWPGEKVTIAISRPTGTAGQTLTVDHATLEISPGIRSTRAELSLSLRSSRGGEHALTLPERAVVDAVTANEVKQPPRQDGRRVIVPIAPGAQRIGISFREPVGLTSFFRASPVDLGLPGVNVDVHMTVPGDRWILMVGGPRMGPAVLFWSFVVVLVLIAIALGRTHLAPLGARQWILLGLGLSQTPPAAAALVAGALLAFGWRRRLPPQRRAWVHNLGQIGFALWTIAAVVVLFSAIKQGLLDPPDMRIAGNGSYRGNLKWFADRIAGAMPQPFVLSVPLLVYRLVMLAWALWLALAVIRWARWIWECFTHGDLWRSRPRAAKLAAPQPQPPPSNTGPT